MPRPPAGANESTRRCEERVDLTTQLGARRRIGAETAESHRDGDDDAHGRCQPQPQAHDVITPDRSEKPTPRTVWIRRGSPPASVLRRR